MAKTMRTPEQAVANYVQNTSNAAGLWQSRTAGADWASGAGSQQAEANYKTGVTAAANNGTRQKAIQKTGNGVFQAGVNANASRYPAGTAAAKARVTQALGAIMTDIGTYRGQLPARGPRGSAQNITGRGTFIQTQLAKNRGKYKATGVAKVSGGS